MHHLYLDRFPGAYLTVQYNTWTAGNGTDPAGCIP